MDTMVRPEARADRDQIATDLAWAQAYCAARDHGLGDLAATATADRCLATATYVALAAWLAAGAVR